MNKLINIADRNIDDNALVIIACTTYNQKKFLKETLKGFLIQKTSFPVEIIIHDDASTDGTKEIIQEYEKNYKHIIKPIYQTENQYTKKIDIVKKFIYPLLNAKYIAICEGDDYWTDPLKLQKQVDFLEQNEEYGLIYTEINRVDEDGSIVESRFFKNHITSFCENFEDYLVHAPFMAPCTWLFRKSLYKERNKKYNVADLPLLLDIAAHSKIHKLDDVTAHYRVLSNSASHFTKLHSSYSFIKGIYLIQKDYAEKYNVSEEIKNTIRLNFALKSYNFAVSEHDVDQIKISNKLLKGHPKVDFKFKVIQLLSKFKFGRQIVRFRLKKILGYN